MMMPRGRWDTIRCGIRVGAATPRGAERALLAGAEAAEAAVARSPRTAAAEA
ncbi:MAG: hypothetical protein IT299_03985 [Dehalococcoidia bacterium]|nr:hypothetical protein [Dehalococcoidia bacterium]